MKNNFGIEIEVNSFDNRDFILKPLKKGEFPSGINEVCKIINDLGLKAHLQYWGHNHKNTSWICKPDSSCGIEICSPVFSYDYLNDFILIVENILKDDRIKIDYRCSIHVHVDINLLEKETIYNSNNISSVLAWWIKCEHVFMDFAIAHRKQNRYCKFIGKTDLFDDQENVSCFRLVSKLSDKYLTLNTYHLFNKKRNSIEFRLGESTKDTTFIKNWIIIINQFLNSCFESSPPSDYKWLDHFDVFDFINFKEDQKNIKNWFVKRLLLNCDKSTKMGQYAHTQYMKLLDKM